MRSPRTPMRFQQSSIAASSMLHGDRACHLAASLDPARALAQQPCARRRRPASRAAARGGPALRDDSGRDRAPCDRSRRPRSGSPAASRIRPSRCNASADGPCSRRCSSQQRAASTKCPWSASRRPRSRPARSGLAHGSAAAVVRRRTGGRSSRGPRWRGRASVGARRHGVDRSRRRRCAGRGRPLCERRRPAAPSPRRNRGSSSRPVSDGPTNRTARPAPAAALSTPIARSCVGGDRSRSAGCGRR